MRIKTKEFHGEFNEIPGFTSGHVDNHMDLPPDDPDYKKCYKHDWCFIEFRFKTFLYEIKKLFKAKKKCKNCGFWFTSSKACYYVKGQHFREVTKKNYVCNDWITRKSK